MALARRYPQRIQEKKDWKTILTADPVQRRPWVADATLIFLVMLAGGIFFAMCVALLKPIWLRIHETNHPNIAAAAFTGTLLANLWLMMVVLSSSRQIVGRRKRLVRLALLIFMLLVFGIMVVGFFYLLGREIVLWLFFDGYFAPFWESLRQTFLSQFGL